jgi:hypothetical protein
MSEHPTWVGDDRYDYLSYGLGGLGDLDGDGYDEFAFGAPYADDNGPSSGSVYVIYGAASALSGGSSDASFNGTGGYALLGFTGSIAGLGDVDGDGYDDAAFGENYAETANGGEVYVMHGSASAWSGNADVDVASDAVFSGGVAYASFGRTVVGADANDDGYADLLVHATLGEGEVGAVYLFYGGVSGFEGDYTTGHAEVTLTGRASFDYFGHTMASGDLDNDGTTDLVVGAHGDDTGADQAGATYVFAGPVTSGDSSTATVTVVGDAVNEAMGWGGTSVGDWSGDGIDDLLNATVSAGNHYGRISLFDGGSM